VAHRIEQQIGPENAMPKENDLEAAQDRGGKHGGQNGMPKPELKPPHGLDQGIVLFGHQFALPRELFLGILSTSSSSARSISRRANRVPRWLSSIGVAQLCRSRVDL
jgi:hypothetical protein